jgi:cell division protein FtsB
MSEKRSVRGILIKAGLLAGVVVLFFVITAIHKETVKKNQIQAEIDKMRDEAERTARSNSTLQEKIAFLSSKDYMETEARDKLNLKSPDEKVVIVKKNVAKETSPAEEPAKGIVPENKTAAANHVKWWDYFFKY